MKNILKLIICLVLFAQCKTQHRSVKPAVAQVKNIDQYVRTHPTLKEHFTGFALFDPSSSQYVVDVNGDLSFTPASNTKLPTFLSARLILGDSIPLFAYADTRDTLVLRGTGAPYNLGQFDNDSLLCKWLHTHHDKSIFYDESHFSSERLGSGWSWDDYQYSYQKEISPMPLHDNAISIQISEDDSVLVSPDYFSPYVTVDTSISWAYERGEVDNYVKINPNHRRWKYRDAEVPIKWTPTLTADLIADACDINISPWVDSDILDCKTMYGHDVDSLYLYFVKTSDNYIAEQIMQMISYELTEELHTATALDSMPHLLWNEKYGKMRWVDGSGLSRYNLFTPKQMIEVVRQLDHWYSDTASLAFYFPYGDEIGTIDPLLLYPIGDPDATPFIYAKTGTLSNNHTLSGWIFTRSGDKLLFSFMNNHYHRPKKEIIKAMHEVLSAVYWRY